jgi:hypothetical protein
VMQWEVGSDFELRESSLVHPAERDLLSAQGWRLPPGECRLVQNGRAALLTALRDACCGVKLKDAWLPSYLCASMVQPFRQSGLEVHYYPVDGSLAPVDGPWAWAVGHGSVVLYVNYFGFPVSATARTLARQQHDRRAVTILDMTHSLFNTAPDEMPSSNYAVASLRKWAGLPDGGLVWKRGSRFSTPLDADSTDGGFGRARLVAGLMKGLYCDDILSQKDGYRTLFGMAEDIADGCTAAVPMSRVSRTMWGQLDSAAIVSARRVNYAVLASGISRLRSLRLFEEALPQGVCPLGCPTVLPCRDDLRSFLSSHGVYCPIHWQLPDEVKTGFPASQSISATILTLPCDERYTTSDMDCVVTLLMEWDGSRPRGRDEGVA